jgi:DNA-binding response OmpR family regulator
MREDILKGYQLGADDYITKPFDTELLLYKIKDSSEKLYTGK